MRHIFKPILFTTIVVFLLSASAFGWGDEEIVETFDAKELVSIKTVSGDCIVKKSSGDKIEVRIISDIDPEDSFEPQIRERSGSLRLTERFYGSSHGSSEWIVSVPNGTRIKFSSASGEFEAEDLDGEFDVSTASGDIRLINCKGLFELSSASGSVTLENCNGEFDVSSASGEVEGLGVVLDVPSEFTAASGDVEVVLASSPKVDLNVSTASGRALLDYNGNPLAGRFEFVCKERSGRIDSPIEFDEEDRFRRHGERYISKTFTKGDNNPEITIHTASGRASLRE